MPPIIFPFEFDCPTRRRMLFDEFVKSSGEKTRLS
jgi:hypothetical protein